MSKATKFLSRSGIIAGLYAVLTIICFPVASGAIQVRLSEGLTLLPIFFPESILGLTVGCIISNIITGCTLIDIIFGSLITLIASVLTYFVSKKIKNIKLKIIIGGVFPVMLNSLLLPLIWEIVYDAQYTYFLQFLFLFLGEVVSVYVVGLPIITTIKRYNLFGVK